MIITLGWKAGAGKWTLSKRLAEYLQYEVIGIWQIKRELAKEMGITIVEFDKIGWENPDKAQEFDLKFEEYQKSLDPTSKIILDGRMAFWCQPDAFKIFLDVDDKVGAERVFSHQRETDASWSLEEVKQTNYERNEWARQTYITLYNVDMYDLSHYDLVIDTTGLTPDEVFEYVIKGFEKHKIL